MIVETYCLCLMDESFLVENVTLWLPFPYDNLSKGFQTETNPWSWCINSQGTNLVLTNWKCLYFCKFFFDQFIDWELSFTISTCQEPISMIVWDSFQILPWLWDNQLFSENESTLTDLFFKIRIHWLINSMILGVLLESIILLFKIVGLILPSEISKFSFFASQLILIAISKIVSNPFPHINIGPRIYSIDIFHIIWKMHSNDFISMNFKTNSNIAINREQIIHINNIILTCCK